MWKLKDASVQIVLRKEGIVITAAKLAADQNLARAIIDSPKYYAEYGHNLVWTGEETDDPIPSGMPLNEEVELVINVAETVKKTDEKPEKESQPTASTPTPVDDGKSLEKSNAKQPSKSEDSEPSKPAQPKKRRRRKAPSSQKKK